MRISKVLVILVAGLFSLGSAAETKIAVVDIYGAIFNSDVAKNKFEEFKSNSSFATLQAKLESTKADIKSLQQDAEKKKLTWSEDDAADFQKKMDFLKADGELTSRKMQSDMKEFESKIVKELNPNTQQALNEIIKEEGVTLLLKKEAVWMVAPELDLTAKLTDRLNKKAQAAANKKGK